MTLYHVQVNNRIYRVDISGNQLSIDGIIEQARLVRLNAANLFLLCRERGNRALFVQPQDGQTYAVTADGRRLIAQVETGRPRPAASAVNEQAGQLSAPMPGLVIAVHVRQGDGVVKGQPLVTQESMKMQMELRSPVDGRVDEVAVRPGEQVEKGRLLVRIQPAPPKP